LDTEERDGKMKRKTLALLLCVAMFTGALSACGETGAAPAESPTAADADVEQTATVEATPEVEPSEPTTAKGIPGSYYTDVVLGMEQYGLTDHELHSAPDDAKAYYTHYIDSNCSNDDLVTNLDYSLSIDDEFQVISATFGADWQVVGTNETFIAVAMNYLGFAATMPYDTANSEDAKKWVQENIPAAADSGSVTATFGDATYELRGVAVNGYYTAFELDISVSEK
jgi:predicted small lipoprotein YifL